MRLVWFSLLSAILICTTSCSSSSGPLPSVGNSAAIGGISGTAIGAGTGAIIGSVIANGDVAASAALGAGVGLPVGVLLGVAYANYVEEREFSRYQDQIDSNADRIERQQKDLDSLRQDLLLDSQTIRPAPSLREGIYTGGTLGNPFR